MKLRLIIMSLGFLLSFNLGAQQRDHMLWEKTPLAIHLPLGEERVIHFSAPISVVDSEVDEDLSVLKIEDALYVKAKKPFINKRFIVQLMPDDELLVLNFSAIEGEHPVTPIEVLLPANKALLAEQHDESMGDREENEAQAQASAAYINPVSLTRFAIQSLYAPARLIVPLSGIVRTPMQTKKIVTLVYGAAVSAHPLISWHADNLYVTAVELKNDLNKKLVLDPRQLLGEWQTATFYPTNTLKPRSFHETTTVFLVSSKPFGDALRALGGFVR